MEKNPKRNKMILLLRYLCEMSIQVSSSEGSGRKGQNDIHIAFVFSLTNHFGSVWAHGFVSCFYLIWKKESRRTRLLPRVIGRGSGGWRPILPSPWGLEESSISHFPFLFTYKLPGSPHVWFFPAFTPVSPLLKKKYLLRTYHMSCSMLGAFQMSFSPSKHLVR